MQTTKHALTTKYKSILSKGNLFNEKPASNESEESIGVLVPICTLEGSTRLWFEHKIANVFLLFIKAPVRGWDVKVFQIISSDGPEVLIVVLKHQCLTANIDGHRSIYLHLPDISNVNP